MTRFQRLLFWVSTAATTVSGLVYFWMKYFLVASDPWAVANHPLQPLMLKLHILAAPIMLFAVGLISTDHIWRHIRSGLPTGRRTGVLTGAVFGPLVLSGYLIQAVTAPSPLAVVTWGHIGLGVACGAGVVLHQYAVRRRVRVRAPSTDAAWNALPSHEEARPERHGVPVVLMTDAQLGRHAARRASTADSSSGTSKGF